MKSLVGAVAATVFAASVSAGEIYHGWAQGNPDLYPEEDQVVEVTGVQPGVGDAVDIYRGFGAGNPDLFSGSDSAGSYAKGFEVTDFDIYGGFATANPDL